MDISKEDREWAREYALLIENRQRMDEVFQPMIYFLFDDSLIVYIGQSRNGLSRVQEHARSKKYTHFTWIPCPVHLLNNTEAYYILRFKPKYNLSLPNNEIYQAIKRISADYGWTRQEVKEIINEYDIPVHEIHGNEYYATNRVVSYGYHDDVWFPSPSVTNEQIANEPGFASEVVDARRQFQSMPR